MNREGIRNQNRNIIYLFLYRFLLILPIFLFFFSSCQSPSSNILPAVSNVASVESIATAPVSSLNAIPTILPIVFKGSAMTIPFRISIGDSFDQEKRVRIEAVVTLTFDEIDKIYNKWNPHSELSQMNTLPANTPFLLSPQMHEFLQRVESLVDLSQGKFDPTIEPLQKLWKGKLQQGLCPDPFEIDDLKPCLGWRTIDFTDGVYIKRDGRTELDFGGVAKGFCVDLLIERIHHEGFENLYVEWGGEIRTIGQHPDKRPWHICIAQPSKEGPMHPIAYLDLINSSIATSGDSYQYWKVRTKNGEEKIYCHIFDPQTLYPLEVKPGSIATAALLGPDCFTADALAKVLMVFSSVEEGEKWVSQLQLNYPNMRCWMQQRSE